MHFIKISAYDTRFPLGMPLELHFKQITAEYATCVYL